MKTIKMAATMYKICKQKRVIDKNYKVSQSKIMSVYYQLDVVIKHIELPINEQ